MALHNCPECNQPISIAAKSCPHCGHPRTHGGKRQSHIGSLLLALFAVAALAIFLDQPSKTVNNGNSNQTTSAAPRCDATRADRLIEKLTEAGIFYRIDRSSSVPKIYVTPAWHNLAIDEKTAFDNAVQCHLMRGVGQRVLAVYLDSRSGREVADTSQYGLTIK